MPSIKPRDSFYIFDQPVPYKKLLIYPVNMREYIPFHVFSKCLMLEKNSIPDPNIISMNYLEYLYYLSSQDKEDSHKTYMDALLRLVLRKPSMKARYGFDKDLAFFEIDGETYNSDDFIMLREIISEQNMLELPDETIQKSVRDKMEETRRFKEKMSNNKLASLEEQIVAVALFSGWDLEQIYNLTVRKFVMALQRADHILHQKIYLQASMSGFVEFKDKSFIRSWLADLRSGNKNADVIVDMDSLQGQISFDNAKAKA